jgi:hypothetical protein
VELSDYRQRRCGREYAEKRVEAFMKNRALVFITILVLGIFVGSGFAKQKSPTGTGQGYDPGVTYEGQCLTTLLFFRYTKNDFWRRRPHMDRLRNVVCQDALSHLNKEGKWQGDLNSDGSCGMSSTESPEWAVGNRVNYDESLH